VPLWGKGRYHIAAVPASEERKDDRAFGGFIIPYSPEYLRFRSNPLVLNDVAARTRGELLDKDSTAEDIYAKNREAKRSSRPIFDWFLVALALLVPLDVGVRRVQLDWQLIKSWLGLGHKRGSTQTMGALLERKQAIDSQIEAKRAELPLTTETLRRLAKPQSRMGTAPTTRSPPNAPPAVQKTQEDDKATTTERLLKLKRKRQTDQP
jgi:hypothetical protein